MADFRNKSKQEKLQDIQDSYINATDGQAKLSSRFSSPGYNKPIMNKVDPEADANMALVESVNAQNAPVQGAENLSQRMIMVNGQPMDMATAARTINPETGLPYSVGAQESNPEDEKAKMKMQYLREMATSGKLGR